jgi:hypothetical protein
MRRVFPKRIGFYQTVFSQPLFWGLVVVVAVALTVFR